MDPASTSALGKAKRSNFKWTTIMERDMIVVMVEEAGNCLKCDRRFKEKSYTTVAKVLSERYKVEVRMSLIQNHLRHVKKLYMTIKGLLSVSGFGWDPNDNVITADPDVWETYCQANPNARDFQGSPSIYLMK